MCKCSWYLKGSMVGKCPLAAVEAQVPRSQPSGASGGGNATGSAKRGGQAAQVASWLALGLDTFSFLACDDDIPLLCAQALYAHGYYGMAYVSRLVPLGPNFKFRQPQNILQNSQTFCQSNTSVDIGGVSKQRSETASLKTESYSKILGKTFYKI